MRISLIVTGRMVGGAFLGGQPTKRDLSGHGRHSSFLNGKDGGTDVRLC